MSLSARTVCLALASLALAPALQAVDVTYGVSLGIAKPREEQAKMVTSKAGVQLGMEVLVDFGSRHHLRPRLDVQRTKGDPSLTSDDRALISSMMLGPATISGKGSVTAITLGADYIYTFDNLDSGPYLTAGMGVQSLSRKLDLTARTQAVSGSFSADGRSTEMAVRLGIGYQFNRNLGLELASSLSPLDQMFKTGTISLGGQSLKVDMPKSADKQHTGNLTLAVHYRF